MCTPTRENYYAFYLKPDIVIKLNIYCQDKENPTINNINNSQLYIYLSYTWRF